MKKERETNKKNLERKRRKRTCGSEIRKEIKFRKVRKENGNRERKLKGKK
jgi:hypothetical protein